MKTKIAICIPAFSNAQNIEKCVDSLIKSNNDFYDIAILLYNNSTKPEIIEVCKYYSNLYEYVQLFDYRNNRGCAITWNDAIEYVYHSNVNMYSSLVIVNDDIEFLEDSFLIFIDAVLKNPHIPVLTMSPVNDVDHYSLFSYSRLAYEKIGFFDENIRPAYFEDADFINRIRLLNFEEKTVDLKLNHLGSSSIPENNLRGEFDNIHLPRTKEYYHTKWNNSNKRNGHPINYIWPFNRVEEKLIIDYSNRKKPYKMFSTVNELPKAYEKFEELKNIPSDNNQLLETIFQQVKGSNVAVCLGFGKGEIAFTLCLSCSNVFVVDEFPSGDSYNFISHYFSNKFHLLTQSTIVPIDIDEIDVLFIDSKHTAENLKIELDLYSDKVNKFIIFHDTFTFGDIGEDGEEGIKSPINEFVVNNTEWKIIFETDINNGMIILGK